MSEISELKSELSSGRARFANECSQRRKKINKDLPGFKLTNLNHKNFGELWRSINRFIFWEVQECFCSALIIAIFPPNSFGSEEHFKLI